MANSIPIKVNNAEGIVEQFGSTDILVVDGVNRRSATGNLVIGSTLGTVEATGAITVAGVPGSPGGTITINGVVLTAVSGSRTSGNDDFSLSSGTVNGIAADIVAAINDIANSFEGIVTAVDGTGVVNLTAVPLGAAGNSITLATSDAVNFTLSGATLTGGVTDSLRLGSATSVVAIQGDLTVAGSSTISVDETVIGDFAVEGNTSLGTGNGDIVNLGGGTSDTVNLKADLTVGAGTIKIGSSVSNYLDALWLDAVNSNGPGLAAYDLNASGTNAGAYAIGVNPALLTNATATDLMTVLDQLDAAISASGADTLQTAYVAGNTISVTASEGTIDFSNNTVADTTTVLTVSRTPASATGGTGISLSMGANTTGVGLSIASAGSGDALFVNNTGTGDALDIQDGGATVLQVTGAGAVNVTPTSGQNATLTTAGVGQINLTTGASGSITLNSTGGGVNLGGGTSDLVSLKANLTVGNNLVGIGSSVTDYLTQLWLVAVNDNGPNLDAYDLKASGTNAGAYAIGVNPALLDNATATDLMTVLDQLDAAITSAESNTLQEAYANGNTIAVTSGNGVIEFSNNTAADTTTVLSVSRTPGSSTAGTGVDLSMGANTTGVGLNVLVAGSGDAVLINNTGSGDALDVQDGGASVFQVTGAGAVNVTPTSGQNLTMTVAGAGVVDVNAAGAITLDSTGAGISLDAAGASNFTTSTGNLTVDTANGSLILSATTAVTVDATAGGVSIDGAGASNFSTSAGNITIDAAAAELIFDDVGNSGLTLSQTGARTLSPTGAGFLYNGVTSIIGAFNAIGVRGFLTKTLPIENGVTIAAGYVVAASTTSGRVTNGTGGGGGNKSIIGIALSGGTGDAGGTVTSTFVLPGAYVTVTGGSFTPGTPVFAPLLAGPPSDTFTGGTGDRNIRLGYAVTSTDIVFIPTVGVGI